VTHDPRPVAIYGTHATGVELVTVGTIGADILRLPAGAGFPPHTHVGHHVLIVLAGEGTITYEGEIHPTRAGQIYIVEGNLPHAVGAITDHVILAVGSPHKRIQDVDRMSVLDYSEVLSPIGVLNCLICDVVSRAQSMLHECGCPHCPCATCCGAEPSRAGLEE
jgi:mannose-6-phosphate isomerase-like protein (cupin superfamily)